MRTRTAMTLACALMMAVPGAAIADTSAVHISEMDAALAATVFHSGQIPIPELKRTLAAAGIEVRPC